MMTLLNKISKSYSIKSMTRGGGGVKNCRNGGDVICGCRLSKMNGNIEKKQT